MSNVIPVILSGGAGTRLWPLSRELRPKQLLPLTSELTLLQQTAQRVAGKPIVVCNDEHRFLVAEQFRTIGLEARAIVVEPVGRNTAPAAAVASLLVESESDALLLVMPSDHLIRDPDAFREAVDRAIPLARQGMLVTFGIHPSGPNTGYGYIHRGTPVQGGFAVNRFVEKPDRAKAESYLASGEYYWNSGIFLFSARTYLDEIGSRRPDMLDGCRAALAEGQNDLFFFRLASERFAAIAGDSIDYAVMEHTDRAAVVPVDMGWSDIGSWSALWQESEQDEDGNALVGDVTALNCRNSYIRTEKMLVAAIGVEDLVVVATDDAILVADKAHDQDVKKIVEALKSKDRAEAVQAARTWRPWGAFQTIDEGHRFKVKHIEVAPGQKLSLQKHWHRSEHWIVVTGTALVTCGDKTFSLRENESTFIPAGEVHRLANPGRLPLRMIEVQSGDTLARMTSSASRTSTAVSGRGAPAGWAGAPSPKPIATPGEDPPMQHTFHHTILREYDIRGIVGETLFAADAFAIGKAFGTRVRRVGGSEVCVGYDGRLSSPELAGALVDGLISAGCSVRRVGRGPTPMLYFAAKARSADGAIMVTGSHNPPTHNGFKMVFQGRPFFGPDIRIWLHCCRRRLEAKAARWTIHRRRHAAWPVRRHPSAQVCDCGKRRQGNRTLVRLPGHHTVLSATLTPFTTIIGPDRAAQPDPLPKRPCRRSISVSPSTAMAPHWRGGRRGRILWGARSGRLPRTCWVRPGASIIADVKASKALR